MTKFDEFWVWVEGEMKARSLSYYRVEREAGLSNAAISKPARNWSEPTLTVCKALAKAFDMPVAKVLEQAGHLPQAPAAERVAEFDEVAEMLASLPDGSIRDEAMAAIRAIAVSARERAAEQEAEERTRDRDREGR